MVDHNISPYVKTGFSSIDELSEANRVLTFSKIPDFTDDAVTDILSHVTSIQKVSHFPVNLFD